MIGSIIKSTGSWYLIRNDKGEVFNSKLRGKFKISNHNLSNPLATGDIVEFDEDKNNLGSYIINKILPRKNYLIRKSIKKKNNGHCKNNITFGINIKIHTIINKNIVNGIPDRNA